MLPPSKSYSNLAHTPFDGSEPLFRIGLRPFPENNWLEIDHCFEEHMSEKRRLIAEIPEKVFQMKADAELAQAETLAMVRGYLKKHSSDAANLNNAEMPDLLKAALLVQEDLVLLRKSPQGWRLIAGAVCFPSSWSLQAKIGKPMHEVHGPVPGFNKGTRNAGMIERIFDNLQIDQPVERYNWSIYNSDALYHDDRSGEQTSDRSEHFLRVERQTLTKLPISGDILFTIRIHVDPFEALQARADKSEIASGFIELLQKLDAEELEYKGLDAGRDILISRLKKLVSSV